MFEGLLLLVSGRVHLPTITARITWGRFPAIHLCLFRPSGEATESAVDWAPSGWTIKIGLRGSDTFPHKTDSRCVLQIRLFKKMGAFCQICGNSVAKSLLERFYVDSR